MSEGPELRVLLADIEEIVRDTLLAPHQNLHPCDPARPALPSVTEGA